MCEEFGRKRNNLINMGAIFIYIDLTKINSDFLQTLSVSFPSPSWSSTFTYRPALTTPKALYVKPGTGISLPEVNT